MKVNIKTMVDDVQCYETVRELRWPEGRECPFCDSKRVIKRGYGAPRSLTFLMGCKSPSGKA